MSEMDRELDRLLTELRDEELPESALASVRSGVRERMRSGKRRRVWTAWLSLAAAAAVTWVAVAIPWRLATLPLSAPLAPEVASVALARASVPREEARLKPGRSLKAAPPRAASLRYAAVGKVRRNPDAPLPEPPREKQTQFIRMMTDDPNVVILWALNSKGETR